MLPASRLGKTQHGPIPFMLGHSSPSSSPGAGPKPRRGGLAWFHSFGSAGADPGFPGKLWVVRALLREPVQRGGGRRRRQLLRRQCVPLGSLGPVRSGQRCRSAGTLPRGGAARTNASLSRSFALSVSLSLSLFLSLPLCLSQAFENRAIPGCWTKRRPSRGPADAPGRVPPTPGEQLRRGTRRAPAAAPMGMGLVRTVGSGPVGRLRPFLKIIRRVAPSEPQLWPLHRFFPPASRGLGAVGAAPPSRPHPPRRGRPRAPCTAAAPGPAGEPRSASART